MNLNFDRIFCKKGQKRIRNLKIRGLTSFNFETLVGFIFSKKSKKLGIETKNASIPNFQNKKTEYH